MSRQWDSEVEKVRERLAGREGVEFGSLRTWWSEGFRMSGQPLEGPVVCERAQDAALLMVVLDRVVELAGRSGEDDPHDAMSILLSIGQSLADR